MLNVQRFLLDHPEERLNLLAKEPYCLKINKYDKEGLVVLNYNQIESEKHNDIVKECRGLILGVGSWIIVSRAFDRFFNYGECPKSDIYLHRINEALVQEKVDGCHNARAALNLWGGGTLKIAEVVQKKLK